MVLSEGQPLPGTPDLARLDQRLAAQGLKLGAPVFLRIFKLEFELELWMEKDGRFQLIRHLSDLPVVGAARPEA